MAYTTIDDPSAHFQPFTYTGNSSSTTTADRSLTNTGNSDLQPDIVWIRNRDTGVNSGNRWWDSSRGVGENKGLTVSGANLEGGPNDPEYGYVNTLSSDGFGVRAGANDGNGRWTVDRGEGGGDKYVAWQWKVGGGSVSNNTDGNITTSVQTNSTAGISIGTYTGNASGSATIGHGLGAVPDLVIIKGRDGNGLGGAAQNWMVGAPGVFGNGTSNHVFLDNQNAMASNTTVWRNESFTSTIIPMGGHAAINGNTAAYVFYAFKNVQGFSKIGTYKGNNDNNGAFVYCGFRPAFLWLKNYDSALYHWQLYDSGRTPTNKITKLFTGDTNDAETSGNATSVDFVSNGFKMRGGYDGGNGPSTNHLFIAFAEHPLVTSGGAPCPAR